MESREQGKTYVLFFAGFFILLGPLMVLRDHFPENYQRWVPQISHFTPDKKLLDQFGLSFSLFADMPSKQVEKTNVDTQTNVNPSHDPVAQERTTITDVNLSTGQFLKNGEALNRFYTKLAQVLNGRRDQVRVMHFGDSQLWYENTARKIRENLQRDFGDGGRGFVYLHNYDSTITLDGVKSEGDSLSFYTIPLSFNHDSPNWLPDVGFSGMTYRATQSSLWNTQKNVNGKPWQTVNVILRAPPGKESLTQTITLKDLENPGAQPLQLDAKLSKECVSYKFDIPEMTNLAINFSELKPGEGSAFIDGFHLERKQGVVYNTYIHKGRHMAWMNSVPEENFNCGYRQMKPDLIIMHFGVNESASIQSHFYGFTKEHYARQMHELYQRIRAAVPDVDILIISPFERFMPDKDKFVYYEEHTLVRKMQQDIAMELGFAFFDSYAFFGGHGQIDRMIPQGLAKPDYAHLTTKGADILGNRIYNEMYEQFEMKSNKKDKISKAPVDNDLPQVFDAKEKISTPIMFNSVQFLYFFIIVGLIAGRLLKWPMARLVFLVCASWYFYATWKWWALLIMLFSTIIDYFAAIQIGKNRKNGQKGTIWLAGSLVANLGLLFFFKYFDFFATLLNPILALNSQMPKIPLLHLILPVGISFYTFQTLSYTIDVWRGKMPAEQSFWRFSLFVSFFTQLVAGPIVRAEEFLPRIKEKIRHFIPSSKDTAAGLILIFGGLFKKTIADWLALHWVDNVFSSPDMYTAGETIMGVYGFGIQIYLDFSGYTDMALGCAVLLGFHLTENFRSPYLAISVSDFWKRWHMSLSAWIRDYIYISMGGNRQRLYFNLLVTMLLAGLWHGAGINFVLWGLFQGVFLVIERLFKINRKERKDIAPVARFLMTALTFHIIMFGWILFRSHDWTTFMGVLHALTSGIWAAPNIDWQIIVAVSLPLLWHMIPHELKAKWKNDFASISPVLQGFLVALLVLAITRIQVSDMKSFIYFQF
jgi:D-alanyl-lipoteichoic acid acyltransferase DltB (MBOAT superfamily)